MDLEESMPPDAVSVLALNYAYADKSCDEKEKSRGSSLF
jgi:hypothetical protein